MADSYVGKPCPKCKHVRTASEVAPDWQCPKCGVAYAKFIAAQQAASAPVNATATAAGTQRGYVARPASGGGSTGLAMFTHLSILIGIIIPFFGLIVPIVVWITKKDSDQLATANAKEAINFQITTILWSILIVGLALLGFKIFAFFFIAAAVGVVLAIAFLVLPIIAAVKANGGDEYRYPITVHIFS